MKLYKEQYTVNQTARTPMFSSVQERCLVESLAEKSAQPSPVEFRSSQCCQLLVY